MLTKTCGLYRVANVHVWRLWEETGTPKDNPHRFWESMRKCKARVNQTWNIMALFSIIPLSQHGWSCCGARKSLDVTSRYPHSYYGNHFFFFFLSFSQNCFHIDLNLKPVVSSGTWNTCFCGSLCFWNVFVVHYNVVIANSTGLKAVSSSTLGVPKLRPAGVSVRPAWRQS